MSSIPIGANRPFEPFAHTLGLPTARVVLVGEAWGESEEKFQCPFVGASGAELARMLHEAGVTASCPSGYINEMTLIAHWMNSGLLLTNVFQARPPSNDLLAWCVNRKDAGPDYAWPAIKSPGKYIAPEHLPHIARLHEELAVARPNLIIALGNVACWALLRKTGITSIRGSITATAYGKLLPTFHPASVLRNWTQRVIVLQDFMKASREASTPDIIRPERHVLVNPTLPDIVEWFQRPADAYAVDIETHAGQITMIGFARSPSDAIVVPFVNGAMQKGHFIAATPPHYWTDAWAEVEAWRIVRAALESPIPKIFQNGLYDLQFIARMGIKPQALTHDTMLLHHSLFPELPKSLGFMGSIYTNEQSWKLLTRVETMKKDE